MVWIATEDIDTDWWCKETLAVCSSLEQAKSIVDERCTYFRNRQVAIVERLRAGWPENAQTGFKVLDGEEQAILGSHIYEDDNDSGEGAESAEARWPLPPSVSRLDWNDVEDEHWLLLNNHWSVIWQVDPIETDTNLIAIAETP